MEKVLLVFCWATLLGHWLLLGVLVGAVAELYIRRKHREAEEQALDLLAEAVLANPALQRRRIRARFVAVEPRVVPVRIVSRPCLVWEKCPIRQFPDVCGSCQSTVALILRTF